MVNIFEHDFNIRLLAGKKVILVECATYETEIFLPQIQNGRITLMNLIPNRRCCSLTETLKGVTDIKHKLTNLQSTSRKVLNCINGRIPGGLEPKPNRSNEKTDGNTNTTTTETKPKPESVYKIPQVKELKKDIHYSPQLQCHGIFKPVAKLQKNPHHIIVNEFSSNSQLKTPDKRNTVILTKSSPLLSPASWHKTVPNPQSTGDGGNNLKTLNKPIFNTPHIITANRNTLQNNVKYKNNTPYKPLNKRARKHSKKKSARGVSGTSIHAADNKRKQR